MSKKIAKLSNCAAAFTLFKAFVGIGILYLPNFLVKSGWAVNPFLMFLSLILTLYCVKLLIESSEKLGADSLPSIAEKAYGKWAKVLTDILIVASQIGFCTSYVYFIASQIGAVIDCIVLPDGLTADTCGEATALDSGGSGAISKWVFLPVLVLMYVPLVYIRKTEKLAFSHLLSDIIIVGVILSASIFGGISLSNREGDEGLKGMAWQGVSGITVGISSAVYAFEGIAVVLPVREITEDKDNFYKLLCFVVSLIALFYIIFA